MGHLQKMCRTPIAKKGRTNREEEKGIQRWADVSSRDSHSGYQSSEEHEFKLFTCSEQKINPVKVQVNINRVPVVMELDTGVSVTVINETVYQWINEGQQK